MVERIAPDEAKRRMDEEGWIYLDVRSVPEFEQGHPEGAYNVPLLHLGPAGMQPNLSFLEAVTAAFDRDAKLIVGCKSGGRSLRAAEMLLEAGFDSVVDQMGGWSGATDPFGRVSVKGWLAAGLPSATRAEPGRSWDALEPRDG